MSPNQYRALEHLVAADGDGLPLGTVNDADQVHRATAAAFKRRGLAIIVRVHRDGRMVGRRAKATTAARQLIARKRP